MKEPGAVMNRQYLHCIRQHSVYYPVALNNEFPNVLSPDLRDHPT